MNPRWLLTTQHFECCTFGRSDTPPKLTNSKPRHSLYKTARVDLKSVDSETSHPRRAGILPNREREFHAK